MPYREILNIAMYKSRPRGVLENDIFYCLASFAGFAQNRNCKPK